jgi:hypothetical protein
MVMVVQHLNVDRKHHHPHKLYHYDDLIDIFVVEHKMNVWSVDAIAAFVEFAAVDALAFAFAAYDHQLANESMHVG